MALIECPECDHEVSDGADRCPHCRYAITRPFLGRSGVERTINIGALTILAIVALFLLPMCGRMVH
jgi:hypothetical protein